MGPHPGDCVRGILREHSCKWFAGRFEQVLHNLGSGFQHSFGGNANSAIEFMVKFTGPLFMTAGSLFGHMIFGEVCSPWDDDIDLLTTATDCRTCYKDFSSSNDYWKEGAKRTSLGEPYQKVAAEVL